MRRGEGKEVGSCAVGGVGPKSLPLSGAWSASNGAILLDSGENCEGGSGWCRH